MSSYIAEQTGYSADVIEDIITRAALKASSITKHLQDHPEMVTEYTKSEAHRTDNRSNIVTLADPLVEEVIKSTLQEHFPDIGFVGEENGETETASRFQWVVDPIDGTRAFSSGNPLYAVSIALENKETREVLAGVVSLPAMNTMLFTSRGNTTKQIHFAHTLSEDNLTESIQNTHINPSAVDTTDAHLIRFTTTPKQTGGVSINLLDVNEHAQGETINTLHIPRHKFISDSLKETHVSAKGIEKGFISLGGASLRADYDLPDKIKLLYNTQDGFPRFQWTGATAVGLAMTALGNTIAMAQTGIKRHDCAAGAILVEGAGGIAAIRDEEGGKCSVAAGSSPELFLLVWNHIIAPENLKSIAHNPPQTAISSAPL